MQNLKGKVAIITGASTGIGESTALHFASAGCWLTLTARNESNLKRVAEACYERGLPRDKVLVVPGDISVEKEVASVVNKAVKHFGKIDILVNNAGIIQKGSVETASMEDFHRAWATNFCGPLYMMKNALPYLRHTKGSVINVSSVASKNPVQSAVPYAVSKAALDQLTGCAALENAAYGVRVNTICPGFVKTTLMMKPGASVEEHMEKLEKAAGPAHAMGRVGTPEEVARCIAFLASDDASFITGATLAVDGGLLLLSSTSGLALP